VAWLFREEVKRMAVKRYTRRSMKKTGIVAETMAEREKSRADR
jgi:hypothetical protein